MELIESWHGLPEEAKASEMRIEYDASKNLRNIEQRGVSFDRAGELLDADPLVVEDRRRDYRERRFIAYGWLDDRLHVCVYTLRGEIYRIISLRRANRREIVAYRAEDVRGSEEVGLRNRLGTGRRDDR